MTDTQRPHNGGERGASLEQLRSFFVLWLEQMERFYDERDRRYSEKFLASETAVQAALTAAKEAVAAALQSQEKAVVKAEAAQQAYNERSNEFRGQLDDQAKRLMPREEANLLISALTEKLESERLNGAARWDEVKKEIAQLREYRSEGQGAKVQVLESRGAAQFSVSTAIALFVGSSGIIIGIVGVAIALLQK